MTVKELYEKCISEIENGNGDRNIILCVNDDEFHLLERGFSSPIYNANYVYELIDTYYGEDEDSVIVLN